MQRSKQRKTAAVLAKKPYLAVKVIEDVKNRPLRNQLLRRVNRLVAGR